MVGDNPYLAHASGSSSKPAKEHPLDGFLPRRVVATQVQKALVRSFVGLL